MPYIQIFTKKSGYLQCVTDGTISDVETFLQWVVAVIDKARETDRSRMLFDNRTLKLSLTPLEVITFAQHLEGMEAARLGFRMASISCPGNLEVSRLIETVIVNRSGSYKVFHNQEEALEWLTGSPLEPCA